MLRFIWFITLLCMTFVVISAEIHPIDVEPVIKKEQPDFEVSIYTIE